MQWGNGGYLLFKSDSDLSIFFVHFFSGKKMGKEGSFFFFFFSARFGNFFAWRHPYTLVLIASDRRTKTGKIPVETFKNSISLGTHFVGKDRRRLLGKISGMAGDFSSYVGT